MRGLRNDGNLVGGAGEIGGLFQGAMVSIIILIPDNALSISPCTRETSEFRNVCRSWSSDVSPCSPSIETELDRAMEDLDSFNIILDLRGEVFRTRSLYQIGDCLLHNI